MRMPPRRPHLASEARMTNIHASAEDRDIKAGLLAPARLWPRQEVLARPCPVPKEPGVYAWYFDELPHPDIDPSHCDKHGDSTLLYVGISPRRPPTNAGASRQSLRTRIRQHYRGNAATSTLRLTLGCLLRDALSLELHRSLSGRLTFDDGEVRLSQWLADNARVCWVTTSTPWDTEEHLIETVDLPLNLDQNRHHPFHTVLSDLRSQARGQARTHPIERAPVASGGPGE